MQHAPAAAAVPLAEHRFPCPSCGSDLRFDPGSTRLRCPHCGHEEPIREARGSIRELDLRDAVAKTIAPEAMEQTRVARCPNCGAEIEFDADLHARECPFCAASIVTDTGLQRHIKPQAQLPFLVTEADARAGMTGWLGRLWFAPSNLRRDARAGRAMQGIYAPYWTYDAETRTTYSGQRGTLSHSTRMVTAIVDGNRRSVPRQVADIRWTPVRGEVARRFDDVPVLGSKSLPKRLTDALAPWDLSALSAFDPRFLAGFRAEGYTVPVEDAYREAQGAMAAVIEADVRRDIGGDRQRIGKLETDVGRLSFKHVLLPVWLAAYRYRGRSFRFAVNGRTGTVEGERPYSAIKIGLAALAGLAVAAAVAALHIAQGGY